VIFNDLVGRCPAWDLMDFGSFSFVRTIYLGTEIFRPIKFSKNNNNKNKTRLWELT